MEPIQRFQMLPSQYPVWQPSYSMHLMSLSRVLRQFACKICKGMSLHTFFNTVFSSPSVETWCFRSSCSIQAHMFSIQLKSVQNLAARRKAPGSLVLLRTLALRELCARELHLVEISNH